MSENLEKIRPALVALEVGESVSFPISRLKSVRTQASELGAIYNRQFKTRTDRENHTITVKRTVSKTKSGLYEDITVSGPSYTIRTISE